METGLIYQFIGLRRVSGCRLGAQKSHNIVVDIGVAQIIETALRATEPIRVDNLTSAQSSYASLSKTCSFFGAL